MNTRAKCTEEFIQFSPSSHVNPSCWNPSDPLKTMRERSWDHFLALGLPNRHAEPFRYVNLEALYETSYHLAGAVSDVESLRELFQGESSGARIVIVNGRYSPELSDLSLLPRQFMVMPMERASTTFHSFFQQHLLKGVKNEVNPFISLNTALQSGGIYLYLPPKMVIEKSIQIIHIVVDSEEKTGLPHICFPRIVLFAGAESQATILMEQRRVGSAVRCVNQVLECIVEEGARIHCTQRLLEERSDTFHYGGLRATLKRDSRLEMVHLTNGSMGVREDAHVKLIGEGAEALLNGLWVLKEKKEAHHHVVIDHQAPHCRSYQLFKGVLYDASRSSFEGMIEVGQQAAKTEAFQLNNNLLMTEGVHADSKPKLQIYNHDVKASHGSTTGRLNKDELFYMVTRGIPEKMAAQFLVHGFSRQVIDLIKDERIKQQVWKALS